MRMQQIQQTQTFGSSQGWGVKGREKMAPRASDRLKQRLRNSISHPCWIGLRQAGEWEPSAARAGEHQVPLARPAADTFLVTMQVEFQEIMGIHIPEHQEGRFLPSGPPHALVNFAQMGTRIF